MSEYEKGVKYAAIWGLSFAICLVFVAAMIALANNLAIVAVVFSAFGCMLFTLIISCIVDIIKKETNNK